MRQSKRIIKQRIVQGTIEDRPRQQGWAMRKHLQSVSKDAPLRGKADDFIAVMAIEPYWSGELKSDAPPWRIRLHNIANWSVSADCADLQGAIKLHARPGAARPESVFLRG